MSKEVKNGNEADPTGSVRVQRVVRRHPWDLPLGTRFRFLDCGGVWVLLETHDVGLCVRWDGIDGCGLPICSVAENREEFVNMEVEVVA